MKSRIDNNVQLDESSVWILSGRKPFNYSDGLAPERYLKKVFTKAMDLSSNSFELEKWIKDWPSEYHLSRKRSQILRGFDFDRSKRVLEVGCGCGPITRFLGETFDDVMAVEGSLARARLARLRTKGMNNVSILCAPFQEIKFKERFDIIFCIGVFEYSGSFVNASDPYDVILKYFEDILNPDGVLVLAIENQFGLKYFSSSREDHTNIMFEGIEGYPRQGHKTRTFGYDELKVKLNKYFSAINFYFPYPDYKLPSCVLSERFFHKAQLGELVANFISRDFLNSPKHLFDEKLVLLELDKNNKLPFFSNSFLVVAGKGNRSHIKFKDLGIMFSTNRIPAFQITTRFMEREDGVLLVKKAPNNGRARVEADKMILHANSGRWFNGYSLHTQIMKRVREHGITLEELFTPCKTWINALNALASRENGKLMIDGKYIDLIWKNSYIENGNCFFIDQEWEWREKIGLNVLVIRSIFIFLEEMLAMNDLNPALRKNSRKILISNIAKILDVMLEKNDFKEFCILESKIDQIVIGRNINHNILNIKLKLWNPVLILLRKAKKLKIFMGRVVNYYGNKLIQKYN